MAPQADSREPQAENPLYRWLRECGFWGCGDPITHVFLDGGKASVPDSHAQAFASEYVRALEAGHEQYAVEMKTPIFRLFLDLDIKTEVPWEEARLLEIVACIQGAVREVFPGNASDLVVCTTPTRDVAGSDGLKKQGMHLHWSAIAVTCHKALLFRSVALKRCAHAFGEDAFANAWNDVIDSAVLRGSGLRLVGSRKRGDPSVYMPRWHVAGLGGRPQPVPDPGARLLDWVGATSVRVALAASSSSKGNGGGGSSDEDGSSYGDGEEDLIVDAGPGVLRRCCLKEHAEVVRWIQEAGLPKAIYHGAKITSVFKIASGADPTYVFRTACKHCFNKPSGPHRSNHVYFVVNRHGLYQKCFNRSESSQGRRFGACKDFRYHLCPLPEGVSARLFPKGRPQQQQQAAPGAENARDLVRLQFSKLTGLSRPTD